MKVNITGPNGGVVSNELSNEVLSAVRFYAKELGICRLHNNIKIRLHQKFLVHDAYGLCYSFDNRNFIIDICLYSDWLSTLAHEMVHVKQFSTGELATDMTRWKNRNNVDDLDYWDQPWEKEAHRLEHTLKNRYVNLLSYNR